MYTCTSGSGDPYTAAIVASDTLVAVTYASGRKATKEGLVCAAGQKGAYSCYAVHPLSSNAAVEVYDATRDGNSLSVDGGRIKLAWSDSP